jgi:hypothetical protein
MRFISTKVHGAIDYLMGVFLIASPWIFGIEEVVAAKWVLIAVGASVIVYSLLTDYELGAYRTLSMNTHLWLDGIGGAFLAASPWLFGFDDIVFLPHLVLGLLEIAAALTTETVPRATGTVRTMRPESRETGERRDEGGRRAA